MVTDGVRAQIEVRELKKQIEHYRKYYSKQRDRLLLKVKELEQELLDWDTRG